MRVDYASSDRVGITLSKRNLLALLHKVDDPTSLAQICITNNHCDLSVAVESDDIHYTRPQGGPGRMVEPTEEFIRNYKCDFPDDRSETEHAD